MALLGSDSGVLKPQLQILLDGRMQRNNLAQHSACGTGESKTSGKSS